MTRTRVGGALLVAAPVWSTLTIVVAGARYPGYSHVRNFISALGAHGARDGFAVSWGAFFVTGVLTGIGALLVWPAFRSFGVAATGVVLAGASTFVGYAGSAVWRCDFGCPESDHSATQSMHFAVSAADLLGLGAGVVLVALALRSVPSRWALARVSVATGIIVLAGAVVLLSPSVDDVQGLLQRIIEGASYAWFAAVGLTALRKGTEYAQGAED